MATTTVHSACTHFRYVRNTNEIVISRDFRKTLCSSCTSIEPYYQNFDIRYIDVEISNINGFDKSRKQTSMFKRQKNFYSPSLVSSFTFMVISHYISNDFEVINN